MIWRRLERLLTGIGSGLWCSWRRKGETAKEGKGERVKEGKGETVKGRNGEWGKERTNFTVSPFHRFTVSNIIAMIPARIGSDRLKMKNLALINNKPLISYAIEAAKTSGVFSRVIVNSDDEVFAKIAERYGAEFYLRPAELGFSTAKSDSVVYDFMLKHLSDILVWVNPISPLQTGEEVKRVIDYFVREELDSLITVRDEQVHCVYNSKPVNFDIDGKFARTQDLKPVQPFVYSIMMWRRRVFIDCFEKKGHAVLCGKIGYYPVSRESSIIIKTKEDIMLADYMVRARETSAGYEVEYDGIVERVKI